MIYFVKVNDKVKIGFSDNLKKRLSALQVSSAYKLEVLLIIDGDYEKESELHQQFREYRNSGEWFDLSDPIEAFIEDNRQNDRRYEFGFVNNMLLSNNQLSRIKKEKHMCLSDVGNLIGITRQSVFEMEQRERDGTISINSMKRYAEVLGYKLEYRFVPIFD